MDSQRVSGHEPVRRKLRDAGCLVLILLAAVWQHAAALRGGFFADDFLFLDQVRRAPSLPALLAAPDPLGNFARPVGRQLYFWVLSHCGHEAPWAFHAANLALFLAAIALVFLITRRLAGSAAAAIAGAILALHYAADVTLQWASGGQELLALVGALGALALFLSGRRAAAAMVLFLALLSKETVVLTPVIAVLAARRSGESWRTSAARVWPLGIALGAWAALWLVRIVTSPGARAAVSWTIGGVAAAFVHLPQVLVGAEWRRGAETRLLATVPPLVPLLLAILALVLAARRRRGGRAALEGASAPPAVRRTGGSPPSPVFVGVAWALLGTIPITAVASNWSAYYYLFSICGASLALGAWLAARPRALAMAAVILLGWGSENARKLDEFITAPNEWSAESHVNPFYIERATTLAGRFARELRRLHPSLPPRSTVFFANLPSFIGLQTADGPMVRWAYRDTSLRSYYLTSFSLEKVRRGPFYFFAVEDDTLRDRSASPDLLLSFAFSMILQGKPSSAGDALRLLLARAPGDRSARYLLAWAQWATGNPSAARGSLARSGVATRGGPSPEIAEANRLIARGDTLRGIQVLLRGRDAHGLDPEVHSRLAAVCLPREDSRLFGVIEAYAVTVLAPSRADGWRKLATAQLYEHQYRAALESLQHYFVLGGAAAEDDQEARAVLQSLRRVTTGDLAQAAIRQID